MRHPACSMGGRRACVVGGLVEFLKMPATPFADPLAMTVPLERPSQGSSLPVISRIVRSTPLERDRIALRAVAWALRSARSAGRSTLGSMIAVGVLLAALGASAGVALRSLAGPARPASAAPPVAVATGELSATRLRTADSRSVGSESASPANQSVRAEAPTQAASRATEDAPSATEPVARAALTARATIPVPRGPHAHATQRSDHRAARGRIHPTSARPLARRTTTIKPKVR